MMAWLRHNATAARRVLGNQSRWRNAADASQSDGHAPLLSATELAALAQAASHVAQSTSKRKVHDHHAGDWPSAWLGRGLDFEEARPYAPGDDIRDMDWRTTARLGHPFVKTYREERQPILYLVLDRGPSMRFGTRRRLKITQAARITALTAFAAAERNTAVGATLWETGEADRELPPRHDRASLLDLMQAVIAPCPPGTPHPAKATTEALHEADRLIRLAADLPRGTRLVLISDFNWLGEAHGPLLARLGALFQVLAVRIDDPVERTLPDVGMARFQDLAYGALTWLDTGRHSVRSAYATTATERRNALLTVFSQANIPCLEVGSEVDDLLPLFAGHA